MLAVWLGVLVGPGHVALISAVGWYSGPAQPEVQPLQCLCKSKLTGKLCTESWALWSREGAGLKLSQRGAGAAGVKPTMLGSVWAQRTPTMCTLHTCSWLGQRARGTWGSWWSNLAVDHYFIYQYDHSDWKLLGHHTKLVQLKRKFF